MFSLDYRFVSSTRLLDTIRQNLHRISRGVDLIVGIPRSGMIPAYAIGLHLNVCVVDLPAFLEDRIPGHGLSRSPTMEPASPLRARRILLVDDSYYTGASMRSAVASIRNAGFRGEIITCAIFVVPERRLDVDVYFTEMSVPRVFEWNLFHHPVIEQACVDFDGVLCLDPTEEENDDGPEYEKFLLNAPPLYLPSRMIGNIVSARLEKYRSLTEEWLARHDVQYKNLYLLDLPSKEERIRRRMHCEHKIRIYRGSDAPLFIESSERQAIEIAENTGKPVLSIETMRIHRGNGIYLSNVLPISVERYNRAKRDFRPFLRRTLPPPILDVARKIKRVLKF